MNAEIKTARLVATIQKGFGRNATDRLAVLHKVCFGQATRSESLRNICNRASRARERLDDDLFNFLIAGK